MIMRTFIFIMMIFVASEAFAGNCGSLTNVTINYEASTYAIEPAVFYVKEGDRVCIRLNVIDESPKNLRMEQAYFWLKASPGKSDEALYVARKKGEFLVTCTGCDKKAKIVVEDAKVFDEREKRYYRERSHSERRNHYQYGR